nr:siderophore-interacting protein [Corynebacterium xerosis]
MRLDGREETKYHLTRRAHRRSPCGAAAPDAGAIPKVRVAYPHAIRCRHRIPLRIGALPPVPDHRHGHRPVAPDHRPRHPRRRLSPPLRPRRPRPAHQTLLPAHRRRHRPRPAPARTRPGPLRRRRRRRGHRLRPAAGDHVRARRPHVRTYTVRRIDRDGTALDVDLVAHGTTSPSARWLAQVRPGDPLTVLGPDEMSAGRLGGIEWRPGAASSILIAGDETALPAIAGIVEQGGVPAGARVRIVVEAPDLRDLDDLRAPSEWTVVRLARPEGIAPGSLLSDAVRTLLADEPGFLRGEATGEDGAETSDEDVVWDLAADHLDGGGYAWLAGEASAVTGLRRHLVRELGVDKSRVSFMGYWRAGREGA